MIYRSFETNFLTMLISSVLNKRILPVPARALEWRELYYFSEFHDITNIVYYALIGLPSKTPEVWSMRFAKVFRKWVSTNEEQLRGLTEVSELLENFKISYMFMRRWQMKAYYPQMDMRAVDDIDILVKSENISHVIRIMRAAGYHYEGEDTLKRFAFYKNLKCRFVFHTELFETNRKFRPFFSKLRKRALQVGGEDGYQRAFGIDDFYIYLMADICDSYAAGTANIHDVIDIHLYLKSYGDRINRSYVDPILLNLELNELVKQLEGLGDLWFGVYEGAETRIIRDIEEYIWSKGSYGRETSITLLPLILDIEIWKIRDQRREHFLDIVHWWFPKREYMASIFPHSEKRIFLMPLFWILRLLHLAYTSLRIRVIRIHRNCVLKKHEKAEKARMSISDEREKNNLRDRAEGNEAGKKEETTDLGGRQ